MNYANPVSGSPEMPDDENLWDAFSRRDRAQDGRFFVAVRTTGIYCKPSCAARRPMRENVEFFATLEKAEQAGYRPCMRCRPDEISRDRAAVEKALQLLEAADELLTLDALAKAVNYTPHHFQRLFTRELGVSPAAYARTLRAKRAEAALDQQGSITEALYDAGYAAPSRFYAETKGRLGMTPGKWKQGGAGERIRHAVVDSSLGPMLVAATDKGLCRISFDEGEADLRARFPNADLLPPDPPFEALVAQVVALLDDPLRMSVDLPVDVRGTAFQQAVWQALRAVPPGETRTYSEIAAMIGRPKAVRAAGSACGDNELAVLIPCHRILRSDGGLGGYAYGLERKRELLKREGSAKAQD